jgi:hypothetical protein
MITMRMLSKNDRRTGRTVAVAAAFLLMAGASGCGSNGGTAPRADSGAETDSSVTGLEDGPSTGAGGAGGGGDGAGGRSSDGGHPGDAAVAVDGTETGASPDGGQDARLNGDAFRDGQAADSGPRDAGGSPDGLPLGLKVLMVTNGAATPTAGDVVMRDRLRSRGMTVTMVSDVAVTAASVVGQDFVVISSSAESGPLGIKIRDVTVPVVCIENGAFPTMEMTGTRLATDYGSTFNQTTVNIAANGQALAGTLSGAVVIASVPSELGWAVPTASAVIGARMADDPTHAALFGYPAGTQMAGRIAPARRVGFAIRETLAANLTPAGLQLFDSAVTFALTRD